MAKKKTLPPAFLQNAQTTSKGKGPGQPGGEIPSGGLVKTKAKASPKGKKGMCPACVKTGAKSCSH